MPEGVTSLPAPPPAPAGADQYGAWFDHAAAEAACRWIETHCSHTEAEWYGRRFILAPWQRDLVRTVFGWKRVDGTRLIRVVYIEIPRKNGKTEFASALALLILFGDGEPNGQVYSLAVDKDQAAIVLRKASIMVSLSPALSAISETYKTSVFVPQLLSSLKPMSSAPGSKHGFSPIGLVGDELHEWPSADLYDVVHKGEGARRQPLDLLITTAGVRGRGFGWEMHCHAEQVLAGEAEDPTFLAVIYAAGPDDDWTDEATWEKANPNLDVSLKREFLRGEVRKALNNPRLENDFRRFHLNQWTEQSVRWLPMHQWNACSADPADLDRWRQLEEDLRGRDCWAGLDLASVRDTTSLVHCFPPVEEGGLWTFLYRFWLPDADLKERARRERVPYDRWAAAEALRTTSGNVTDYRTIKQQIYADGEVFRIREIAIDRWNATQLAVELQEDGLPVVLFGQGFASMSAPAKELERLVTAGLVEHGNHPLARWQAGNAVVKQDPAGNIKPDKEKATQRIDGVVAMVMALGRAQAGDDTGMSIYDRLGAAESVQVPAEPVTSTAGSPASFDRAVLADVHHPRFAEERAKFESWQAAQRDDDWGRF